MKTRNPYFRVWILVMGEVILAYKAKTFEEARTYSEHSIFDIDYVDEYSHRHDVLAWKSDDKSVWRVLL